MFLWFLVCLNPGEDSSLFLGFVSWFLRWNWPYLNLKDGLLMEEATFAGWWRNLGCSLRHCWWPVCVASVDLFFAGCWCCLYLFQLNWFVSMEFGKRFSICRFQREDSQLSPRWGSIKLLVLLSYCSASLSPSFLLIIGMFQVVFWEVCLYIIFGLMIPLPCQFCFWCCFLKLLLSIGIKPQGRVLWCSHGPERGLCNLSYTQARVHCWFDEVELTREGFLSFYPDRGSPF